jgi:hypothetical protein
VKPCILVRYSEVEIWSFLVLARAIKVHDLSLDLGSKHLLSRPLHAGRVVDPMNLWEYLCG